jgi:hypothetical protein
LAVPFAPDPETFSPSRSLRTVQVRLLQRGEKPIWNHLMREHHYLGFQGWVGESLRYVAQWDGVWVALVGWCAAALKCGARDGWIGWPEVLQRQRLALIANNARFLILPGPRVANLASRVLGLTVKRLSGDWQQVHGHPVLLAESFIDPQRFSGTCYRAAGWIRVGQTRGYGRRAAGYRAHGEPKTVWVRPLVARAAERLRSPVLEPAVSGGKLMDLKLSKSKAEELIRVLMSLPESRARRGIRHDQSAILAVAICAVLGGARSYVAIAEWAKRCAQNQLRRLGLRRNARTGLYQPPSEPTIRRVLQGIDAEQVDRALTGWVSSLGPSQPEAIALDGKTLRGSGSPEGQPVQLLSAIVHGEGIVVAQREVSSKSNEIPEAPALLAPLDLAGSVVTADALHTQKNLARFVVETKKADYVLSVKDNQPTLKQDIAELFESESFPPGA